MNHSPVKIRTLLRHISKNRNFLKFCVLNILMQLTTCTKFHISQTILTMFSGLLDKNHICVAEKNVKCRRQVKVMSLWTIFSKDFHYSLM